MDLGAGKPGSCPCPSRHVPSQPASLGSQRFLRTQDRAEPSGWPGPWGPMEGGSLGGVPGWPTGAPAHRPFMGSCFSAVRPGPRCGHWGEVWGHHAGSERPRLPATVPPPPPPACCSCSCVSGRAIPALMSAWLPPPTPSPARDTRFCLCALAVVSRPGKGKAWH